MKPFWLAILLLMVSLPIFAKESSLTFELGWNIGDKGMTLSSTFLRYKDVNDVEINAGILNRAADNKNSYTVGFGREWFNSMDHTMYGVDDGYVAWTTGLAIVTHPIGNLDEGVTMYNRLSVGRQILENHDRSRVDHIELSFLHFGLADPNESETFFTIAARMNRGLAGENEKVNPSTNGSDAGSNNSGSGDNGGSGSGNTDGNQGGSGSGGSDVGGGNNGGGSGGENGSGNGNGSDPGNGGGDGGDSGSCDNCRPGVGIGDPNHEHTGAPGQANGLEHNPNI